MPSLDDVRRLALALPETDEKLSWGHAMWRVKGKGFVWERPLRAPDLEELGLAEQPWEVIGARVADEGEKQALVEEDPSVFFTVHHLDGYDAILARLDAISSERLEELVTSAWLERAPARLAREHGF